MNVDSFDKFVVVGDRILLKPRKSDEKTESGLYLPPNVQENEKVHSGYVIKTGPGYPIPVPVEEENWRGEQEKVKYIPVQANEGDLAIYLQNQAYELAFNREKYVIISQSGILMLIRDEGIFE